MGRRGGARPTAAARWIDGRIEVVPLEVVPDARALPENERLEVAVGGGVLLTVPRPIEHIAVADPRRVAVENALPTSRLWVRCRDLGTSDLTFVVEDGPVVRYQVRCEPASPEDAEVVRVGDRVRAPAGSVAAMVGDPEVFAIEHDDEGLVFRAIAPGLSDLGAIGEGDPWIERRLVQAE